MEARGPCCIGTDLQIHKVHPVGWEASFHDAQDKVPAATHISSQLWHMTTHASIPATDDSVGLMDSRQQNLDINVHSKW
jgi:hypothetical protein